MEQVLNSELLKEFDSEGIPRNGLPSVAYTSDSFLELENNYLFSRNWVFVGFAHQLAKAGDVVPVSVAGQPLLILRNETNEITAFHNVCRHRSLQMVDKSGNCGRKLRCPYHSWSYDLHGKLKNAPFFGGSAKQPVNGFEFEQHGLVPVNCAIWHDWIFVNLATEPESFESFLQPIKRMLGDTDVTRYRPVATIDLGEIRTNWKLLMENFIEPYHVQFVHKTTTSQPLEDHYPVIEGKCLGSAVDLSDEQVANAGKGTLGVSSRYLTLFPNFVLGTYQPDQMGVHLNVPVDTETTSQFRVIYAHEDANYSAAKIQGLKDLWYAVHREDHAICERLQTGRRSDVSAQGGVLSPHWETSVRSFQELVADAIRPGLGHYRSTQD
jgi:choline monooxygenase